MCARVWIGPVAKHEPGGVAHYIQSLVAHSTHRLMPASETPELLWGLRWIGKRVHSFRSAYAHYQRWIRRIDVAHIHRSFLYAEPFQAMGGRIPWIFTLHGIGFEEHRRGNPEVVKWIREYKASVLRAIEDATLATVVSRWLRDWVEERVSASVIVTPPGIDLQEFERAAASEFLRWSGISEGFVLWVGRLSEEKRLDLFIKLASRLEEHQFVVMANSPERQFRAIHGERLPTNLHYVGMAPRRYVVSA
ncbi:MAG: glycosyltransferase, partial [Thermoplasmata archaeon]